MACNIVLLKDGGMVAYCTGMMMFDGGGTVVNKRVKKKTKPDAAKELSIVKESK